MIINEEEIIKSAGVNSFPRCFLVFY